MNRDELKFSSKQKEFVIHFSMKYLKPKLVVIGKNNELIKVLAQGRFLWGLYNGALYFYTITQVCHNSFTCDKIIDNFINKLFVFFFAGK